MAKEPRYTMFVAGGDGKNIFEIKYHNYKKLEKLARTLMYAYYVDIYDWKALREQEDGSPRWTNN